MNERIEQLAAQACVVVRFNIHPHTYKQIDDPNGMHARLEFNKEKFAELIARECAQLAMTQHNSTSPDDYDEMDPYDKGCDDTASRISGLIRRTFGVE